MIHYLVHARVAFTIREYLEYWGRDIASRMQILPYEELLRRTRLDPGTYILAGLEHLGRGMTELVAQVQRSLEGRPGFRFLNDARRTLRRYDLLVALHDRGWNDFRAFRPGDDLSRLRYPVFLRSERFHRGPSSPLLRSERELDEAMGRALVSGRLRDLIVVEFRDTAGPDGLYRKYSAFVVGDRVIARSMERGSKWMLKHQTGVFTPDMAEEEVEYVTSNPHANRLAEIAAFAGVQYGRIDYAVAEGRVLTWEINLNPRVGRGIVRGMKNPKTPEVYAIRERGKEAFYAGFQAAFEAVDVVAAGPPVLIDVEPRVRRRARELAPGSRRWANAFVRLLAPALEALAAPLLPHVGRLARRSSGR